MGRVVIPADLRRDLGMEPGAEVSVVETEDGILIRSRRQALERIRRRLAEIIPRDVSLVDDLIAERRREARRERS